MLVVAKKPHIKVTIAGIGVNKVIKILKENFPDAEIKNSEDDKLIDIHTDSWFQNLSKSITPGKVLWGYRDNARLTLAQLSKLTDIAVPHLSAMENDKRSIGKITAQKLAKALKCDYKRFL